jgi:hypothetical protein
MEIKEYHKFINFKRISEDYLFGQKIIKFRKWNLL